MEELWVPITQTKYEISNLGNVRTFLTKKNLKIYPGRVVRDIHNHRLHNYNRPYVNLYNRKCYIWQLMDAHRPDTRDTNGIIWGIGHYKIH